MILHTVLLALLLQAAPVAKASISGVAINSGTGEPIANVRVSLARTDASLGAFAQLLNGGQSQTETTISGDALKVLIGQLDTELARGGAAPEMVARAAAFKALPVDDIHEITMSPTGDVAVLYKSSLPVLTDDRGRFAFNTLDPGTYRLVFSGDGYARQGYGQRAAGGGGVPMILAPGQAKSDVVMRMSAVAAISGRVVDVAGQPLAGIPVQAFRFSYDASGQKRAQRVAYALSDDHGNYRLYYLSAGRYYLGAGNEPRRPRYLDVPPEGGYLSDNQIVQSYALAYYPGVADQNSAAPIDVPPGGDLRGLDMLLSVQGAYDIRGRVVDARTGQSASPATITLKVQTSDTALRMSGFTEAVDGNFEMHNVSPGTYILTGSLSGAKQTPALNAAASATVNVVNADIDVVLTLGTPAVIPGRIQVEASPGSPPPSLGLMRVDLRTFGTNTNAFYQDTPRFQSGDTSTLFRIENVLAGEYRVSFIGLPAGFYVKEAHFGDADLLNGPLRFTARDSQTLDVLISSSSGAISGTAADAAGQPTAGAQVVLIPSRNRERPELFRSVTADSSGRFTIPAIAPGEYILAAWDAIEPFAFFDPALMRQAEVSGKAIRVPESSSQMVNVTSMAEK